MQIIEVKDRKNAREFLDVARVLYKGDKNWVCQLDQDINAVFDPGKNNNFKKGGAARWVLKDGDGLLIGRIAAFYNEEKALKFDQPTGGCGFFECINNREAAFELFDTSRQWLSEHGMEAMDGPVNFGENDYFWGLLIEGFTPPAYGMNYNPPYYRELFESYGFKIYFEQITKHLDTTIPFPDRFWKIAEWVMRKPGFSFEHFSFREVDKFSSDLIEIYNATWVNHEHFTPLTSKTVRATMEAAKPVLIEDFIWFAYHEGKPIAFMVMLPDVNQILRHLNGKLHLINKLRFLYYKWTKTITRNRITILGVVPQFQGAGIDSCLFWHLQEPVLRKRPHIKEVEISWVGDFNPKMQATVDAMNAKPGKKHITYRKLFDDSTEVKKANTIWKGREA